MDSAPTPPQEAFLSWFERNLRVFRALEAWFSDEGLRGVVVGGVAASLIGTPRATQDVDAMILWDERDEGELLRSAERHGFEPRGADPIAFARAHNIFLLRHRESGVGLDLSLGMMPFEEEMVERAQRRTVHSVPVRIPSPEDLIIMKTIAGRDRDLRDIEGILHANRGLDEARILDWVAQFAEVLETPARVETIKRLLAEAKRR